MIVWLLGTSFLALICILASLTRPYDSYLSPVTVFGLGAFLYIVAIPMEVAVTGSRYLRLHTLIYIPESVSRTAVVLAFCAYLAFFAGYWLVLNRERPWVGRRGSAPGNRIVRQVLGFSSLATISAAVALFPSMLVATRVYETSYTERFENPLFSALSFAAVLSTGMYTFAVGRDRTRGIGRCVALVVALTWWGVYSNQKSPIVIAGLALGSLLLRGGRDRRHPFLFTLLVFSAPIVLGISALVFSLNRGGGSLDLVNRIRLTGFLTGVEPAGPFYSLVVEVRDPGASAPGIWPGESVLHAAVGWVPRVIWPGRPMDLSLAFAQTHKADWQPGQGFGFSPIAEGLVQGGIVGLGAFFFLIGIIVASVRNTFARVEVGGTQVAGLYEAFFFVGVIYLCFIFFRGPLQGFVTGFVQSALILVPLAVAAHVLKARADRLHARALAVQTTAVRSRQDLG